MADVTLRKVIKRYDDVEAVRGIDLDIADHEFVVLVGPSGCGKSTTLRMIAGLEDISGGDIMIGGDVVNDVPPKDRDIAMVFQNYALYPHMTVAENMSFGLRLKRYPKAEIKSRIDEAARMLDIVELVDRKPKQLSGGQRQRVAMGRAIVRNPKVFLEAKDTSGFFDAFFDFGLGVVPQFEPEREVVVHRHVRVERVVLEDHGDVAVPGRHVVDHAVAEADRARRDPLQPRDHPQRCRLAAAGGPDQHDELAVRHVQVEGVQRLDAGRVDLGQLTSRNRSHDRRPPESVRDAAEQ